MEYKSVTVSAVWSFDTRVEELMNAVNDPIAQGGEPRGAPVAVAPRLIPALSQRR